VRSVEWCGVVWCGVVWCLCGVCVRDVVWCGVMWWWWCGVCAVCVCVMWCVVV